MQDKEVETNEYKLPFPEYWLCKEEAKWLLEGTLGQEKFHFIEEKCTWL